MSEAPHGYYVVGGTMRQDAASYVTRKADTDMFEGLARNEFSYVLTSRQMGKSSLLVRCGIKLREAGFRVVVLDITAVGRNITPEQWYEGLLSELGQQVGLEDELEAAWLSKARLGPMQRFMRSITDVVFPALVAQEQVGKGNGRMVIFVDEIDFVRSLPFSTDEFFAGIREAYNRRTHDPEMDRITFCLSGVATPSDLVRDTRTTPFNIGRRIELTDFAVEEADCLGKWLERKNYNGAAMLKRVLYWTGGHPYLTQRLCAEVAQDSRVDSPADIDRHCEELFLAPRARERDDNLLFVRERLLRSEADLTALLELYAHAYSGKRTDDDETNPLVTVLRLSGITRSEDGFLKVRNQIYHRVFNLDWVNQNIPDSELKRQRAAAEDAKKTAQHAQSLLAQNQTEKGVQTLLARDPMGLLDLLEARRAVEEAPEQREALSSLWCGWHQSVGDVLAQVVSHRSTVRGVAFSPDGQTVATASFDTTARLTLTASGAQRAQLSHPDPTQAIAWSADGKLVATAAGTNAYLWDAATGQSVGGALSHDDRVTSVVFAPDGKLLATGCGDSCVWLWELGSGAPRATQLRYHDGAVTCVALSRDGKLLASGSEDRQAMIWELTSRRARGLIRTGGEEAMQHEATVTGVAFSPDARLLATACDNGTVKLWGVAGISHPHGTVLPHNAATTCVCFSPESKLLATGSEDGAIRLWETTNWTSPLQLLRHQKEVWALAFNADGSCLASASSDATARVWKVSPIVGPGPLATAPLRHVREATIARFLPDGRLLATGSPDTNVRLWVTQNGQPYGQPIKLGGEVTALEFAANGQFLVTGASDGAVRLWNPLNTQPLGAPLLHPGPVRSISLSANSKFMATVTVDNAVRLWLLPSGQLIGQPLPHTGAVAAAVFGPAGKLATASLGEGILWETQEGKLVARTLPKQGNLTRLQFSPDGRLLATLAGGTTLRLWETDTLEMHCEALQHEGTVSDFAFHPGGELVATAKGDTVRLWNAHTGSVLGPTLRHEGAVSRLLFSPEGQVLVAVVHNEVVIWETANWLRRSRSWRHEGPITDLVFSAGGVCLATTSSDRTARLWRMPTLLTELIDLEARTHIALGARLNAQRLVEPIPSTEWRKLRSELGGGGNP